MLFKTAFFVFSTDESNFLIYKIKISELSRAVQRGGIINDMVE